MAKESIHQKCELCRHPLTDGDPVWVMKKAVCTNQALPNYRPAKDRIRVNYGDKKISLCAHCVQAFANTIGKPAGSAA